MVNANGGVLSYFRSVFVTKPFSGFCMSGNLRMEMKDAGNHSAIVFCFDDDDGGNSTAHSIPPDTFHTLFL